MPFRPSWTHGIAAALGAAISLATAAAWSTPPSAPPPAGPSAESRADEELRSLRAEVAVLRRSNAGSERQDASAPRTDDPPAAATASEQTPAQDAALLERLLAELEEQRHARLLRRYYAQRLPELAEVLMRVWLEAGSPLRAWQLLAGLDGRLELAAAYRTVVATALQEAHLPEAVDAFLLMLRHDIQDTTAITQLAGLDGAAAMAALDAHEREHADDPKVAGSLRDERARLLFRMGRTKEALAMVEQILADGEFHGDLWQQLVEQTPARAVAWLREQLAASTDEDTSRDRRRRLVDALMQSGDARAARSELDRLLADAPLDADLLRVLGTIDAGAAESRWRERLARQPGAESTLGLAHQLRAVGKNDEAEHYEWQAFLQSPGDTGTHEALLRDNSLQMAERMLTHTRSAPTPPDYDELLGNIADVLWRHGQHERAADLWRQAQSIDPGDSEWSDNLRAIAAGRDPMAGAAVDWWRLEMGNDW